MMQFINTEGFTDYLKYALVCIEPNTLFKYNKRSFLNSLASSYIVLQKLELVWANSVSSIIKEWEFENTFDDSKMIVKGDETEKSFNQIYKDVEHYSFENIKKELYDNCPTIAEFPEYSMLFTNIISPVLETIEVIKSQHEIFKTNIIELVSKGMLDKTEGDACLDIIEEVFFGLQKVPAFIDDLKTHLGVSLKDDNNHTDKPFGHNYTPEQLSTIYKAIKKNIPNTTEKKFIDSMNIRPSTPLINWIGSESDLYRFIRYFSNDVEVGDILKIPYYVKRNTNGEEVDQNGKDTKLLFKLKGNPITKKLLKAKGIGVYAPDFHIVFDKINVIDPIRK